MNEINSLAKTFQEYEEATGAKLNFEKCFVLSTQAFEPEGPWADMPKKNFQSECTVYLGVPISKKIELKREWNPILQKMRRVANLIKEVKKGFEVQVRLVNTYLISLMGYLARFKIMPQQVATEVWKIIRTALGAECCTRTNILTGTAPPFDSKPKLIHSVLFNWALLNSREPMSEAHMNPNSICEMRKDANWALHNLGCQVELGCPTK